MSGSNSREAHLLQGWVSAIGLGVLTCGIALFAYGLSWLPAILMGGMVTLIIGLVFSFAMGGGPVSDRQPAAAASRSTHHTARDTGSGPKSDSAAQQRPLAGPATAKTVSPDATAAPADGSAPVERPGAGKTASAAPAMLDGPQGAADDLKQINGVGPVLEGKLNKLGIYHFWQIAAWTPAEIDWVDSSLSFKGRIQRDNWITQAQRLAQQSPARAD